MKGQTMDQIKLAIVGCGGMGGRHLLGLGELQASGMNNVELVAVCDLRTDNAENLADNAAKLLGKRPQVFGDMAKMVAAVPDLAAVDITTDAGSHHRVACTAFDLGLNVLCEKPMAITVKGCNLMLAAQKRSGKVLSIAENYRRDPMNRLTRALLEAGVIGQSFLFLDVSAGSGNQIIITPWRHQKHMGGMLLDGGVHNTDLMLYLLGDAREVYGKIQLWEPKRYRPKGGPGVGSFYERWANEVPEVIDATAEDTLVSVISFADGTLGQWTQSYAGHGQGFGHKAFYGSKGSMLPGGSRNGVPPVLKLDGQEAITGEALLPLAPDYHLDAITTRLYGGERLGSFKMPFPDADRKLLAIEYYEFADCVLTGKTPEVDGLMGRRAMALCYAAFESSVLNRPVTLDEVEAEKVGAYEADINAHWHI
jgi:predicted dehydrogenase